MEIDVNQALRYLGVQRPDKDTAQAVARMARQVEAWAAPRWVYRVFSVSAEENGAACPEAGLVLPGKLASGMLRECQSAALLACTLGAEFDRRLLALQARDMAQAVMADACGSAWVEAGCDEAEREIAAAQANLYLTDRFSPGYGDLPLTLQPSLLRAVNAEKRLGVYAAPSLMLTPLKTVTAIIGLSDRPQGARIRGCGYCGLKAACAYRERGLTCEISA